VEVFERRNAAQRAGETGFPAADNDAGKRIDININLNLTNSQKELLGFLVSQDKLSAGQEFILTRDQVSMGILYPGGLRERIPYGESDFKQLQSERLITFYRVSRNVWRGKPTQLGLTRGRGDTRPEIAPIARPQPEPSPAPTSEDSNTERKARLLNVELIGEWMSTEGYDNKELADALNISIRAISSMRNNGDYHGQDAVTKLANLMNRDVDDLFLP
jgi:hypothetical protein